MTRRWTSAAALVALLAVAAWLRARGLAFGLPAVYNMDEVAIVSRALAFATGDLNPHNFVYPTFYFYALFAWLGATFVAGWIAGAIPSVEAYQQTFFTDPTVVYLSARTLTLVCGVAAVGVTYALARRLADRTAGLAAAAFLAAAPIAVRDAHYVKHDVPVALLAVAVQALLAHALLAGDPRRSRLALYAAAVLTGLAASTHYYAVFLAVPLALGVLAERSAAGFGLRGSLPRLAAIGGATAVAFAAGSPFLLLDPSTAWRDIVANRQIVVDRALDDAGLFASAGAYARMLALQALGWPVAALAVAGTVVLFRRTPRAATVLVAFPAVFLAFIANTVAAGRYLNPVLPAFAALAGVAVSALAVWLGARTGARPAAPPLAVVLVALALVPGLRQSLALGKFFRQDDTRTLAQRWIEANVPEGDTVLIQPYSVALRQSKAGLAEALRHHGQDPARASTKFALQLALEPYPSPAYRLIWLGDGGLDKDKIYVSYAAFGPGTGLAPLREAGVRFVVLKRYNSPDPAAAPVEAALEREARLVASFPPWRPGREAVEPFLHNTDSWLDPALERPGPGIDVWQVAP